MNLKPNVLIFSVFQKGTVWSVNRDRHAKVMQDLETQGVPCIELTGKYNNELELSILVQGFEFRPLVEALAKKYSQECYLESYSDRSSALVYPDGRREMIGTLTPVSKLEADAVGSWSYNKIADQYFITK